MYAHQTCFNTRIADMSQTDRMDACTLKHLIDSTTSTINLLFCFFFVEIVVNWFITDAPPISSIYVCASSVDFRKFFFAINFTACNILAFLRHFNITSHTANIFFTLIWLAYSTTKIQSRRAVKFRLWLFNKKLYVFKAANCWIFIFAYFAGSFMEASCEKFADS